MQLRLRTFSALVQSMAAAVESSATQLLDLTTGSTLRAVIEASASIGLWMQWLTLQVLRTTRAATCDGADLDSWMADLTLQRLPAVAATGIVTFSRYTQIAPALVPAGAQVRTRDGTQTFVVVADESTSSWSGSSGGYVIGVGVTTVDVPVVAQSPGIAGNVQAGAISLLVSALPGIDSVSNVNSFQNGLDAEADNAFRDRFRGFMVSHSRATPLAVGYAISTVQQGLGFTIQENIDPAGQTRVGHFVVTVDDGSGKPSTSLLSAVQSAIDEVRPVGSVFTVQPPTIRTTRVSLMISVVSGVEKAPVQVLVGNAIRSYINGLAIGAGLPLSRIAQLAYSASSDVINVRMINVDDTLDDLVTGPSDVIRAGIVAVS